MIGLSLCLLALGVASVPDEEAAIPPNILQVGGIAQSPPSPSPSPSQPPSPPAPVTALKTDPAEADALGKVLRELLLKNLPDPVSKSSHNWGHQKAVTVTRHHLEGFRLWSESVQEMRNDGVWRHADIRIPDRDKTSLAVTELTHPEPGKIRATVSAVAERVDLRFEQQVWKSGARLYGGESRGHCRGALTITAEIATKTELPKGSFFPRVTLKLQVTSAKVYYEKLVVDHAAGLSGEAAKVLGDVTIQIVKAIKPNLEQELLQKADAAIVKAARTKELTLTLDKLLAIKDKK